MLKSTVGAEKGNQIQTQIQDLLHKRDPFIRLRFADSETIASILIDEHPQAIAVVLSELSAKKSSEVLGLLGEGIRVSAISRMTGSESVTAEAKTRIAEMTCKRLKAVEVNGGREARQAHPEQSLRKVAMILRNLGKELRDGLLRSIKEKDNKAGKMVANLMIVWEDIPQAANKSLQEALRGFDAQELALALVKADEAITEKVRSNISERVAVELEEETSLMSAPRKEDIKKARGKIVQVLREMNEKGKLVFEE